MTENKIDVENIPFVDGEATKLYFEEWILEQDDMVQSQINKQVKLMAKKFGIKFMQIRKLEYHEFETLFLRYQKQMKIGKKKSFLVK